MWFSASLLYKSEVSDGVEEPALCEVAIAVLEAENEQAAEAAAIAIGRSNEHSYRNVGDDCVVWQFIKVLELQELTAAEIGHGVEVYSRLFHEGDSVSLLPG